jgi:uncharacterized protein YacL
MVEYDAEIIKKFAAQLYRRASVIQWLCLILFIVLGFVAGVVVSSALHNDQARVMAFLFIVILSFLLGYGIGHSLAFQYRLQAQMAFVQVQIEKNTKEAVGSERTWTGGTSQATCP